MSSVTNGESDAASTRTKAKKAPNTAKSPCARLTTRITPNMSESPVANSAYIPPSRTPCTIALTSVMTRRSVIDPK